MNFSTARRRMVESQVRPNDVTDLRLQTALEETPREKFLPVELHDQAYVEREHVYAPGRTLITVRDFAKLAAAAEPKAGELVLNAGGAIEQRPEKLLSQLKDGGRLAAILRQKGVSRGVIYRRSGEAFACTEKFDAATRVILPGFETRKSFVF